MKKKYSIKYHIILTVITLLLLLLPVQSGTFFGSNGDWYSQHVAIADSLRKTMLETGSLIPQYMNLGAGSSIYDFAYYGLLRPDILVSCLMPKVEMRYIIAVYAVAEVVTAVNLCFYWLKKRNIQPFFAFMGAVLMACSTCFYHAHCQLMFVNYMPYLVLALIGVDRFVEQQKKGLLIGALFFVYMHSFYYSISCLAVLSIYAVYRVVTRYGWNQFLRYGIQFALSVALSVGLAMVLLLPMGLDILSVHKDGGKFVKNSQQAVDFGLRGLLYNAYGCGMTLVSLYCLLLSLTRKGKRLLSACLLMVLALPVVSYVLNGFLYSRAKILIPFVTLLAWNAADTLQWLYNEARKREMAVCACLCLSPIFVSSWKEAVLIDWVLLMVWVLVLCCGKIKKKRLYFSGLLIFPMLFSFCINAGNSYLKPISEKLGIRGGDQYLSLADDRQRHFSPEEISGQIKEKQYRFDNLANNFVNSNLLADGSVEKTAMYSSITNSEYASYFYDTMKNAISVNNRIALVTGKNPCFSYLMGIRYVLSEKEHMPEGYKILAENGSYVLAENKDVLPVCYGTSNLLNEDEFNKLIFPNTLEALCENAVVKDSGNSEFQSHVWRENADTLLGTDGVDRLMNPSGQEETYTLSLKRTLHDTLFVLSFHVESPKGKEAVITINGIRNKLSAKNAPYPNENHDFTYIFSSGEALDTLEVKMAEGNYQLSNLKIYTVKEKYLKHTSVTVPTVITDGSNVKRSSGLSGKWSRFWSEGFGERIFSGVIDMAEDGYFITSYPWRKGYQVVVDGERIDYEKVNTAFMGFPIESGVHTIEIQYETPGFMAGLLISLGCFLIYSAILLPFRKKNMSNVENKKLKKLLVDHII